MRFPNFSMNPLIKRMAEEFLLKESMERVPPSALTIDLRPSRAGKKTVWRPPRQASWLSRIFTIMKSVVSAFYNAMLVFQNGRAFITKFRRLLI